MTEMFIIMMLIQEINIIMEVLAVTQIPLSNPSKLLSIVTVMEGFQLLRTVKDGMALMALSDNEAKNSTEWIMEFDPNQTGIRNIMIDPDFDLEDKPLAFFMLFCPVNGI